MEKKRDGGMAVNKVRVPHVMIINESEQMRINSTRSHEVTPDLLSAM